MDAIDEQPPQSQNDASKPIHPESLRTPMPAVLTEAFSAMTSFLAAHGWTLLFVLCILYALYLYLEPQVHNLLRAAQERRHRALFKEEKVQELNESLHQVRQRQQAAAAALAQAEKEKEDALLERQRQEKIEEFERNRSLRLGTSSAGRRLNK